MFFIKGIETSFTEVLMLFINPFKSVYGVTCFLWATFWCYLIYNELSIRFKKQYQKLCIVLILSFAGFYMNNIEIGSHRLQLPMYMSTSLSCMLFLYTGEYLKQINVITPPHQCDNFVNYKRIISSRPIPRFQKLFINRQLLL